MKKWSHEIDPDEIFLDSSNIPDFDTQQFEGRLERPISRATVVVLGVVFILLIFGLSSRVFQLQVARGETYQAQSENNRLEEIPIFGVRGVVYDRNQVKLAWNEEAVDGNEFYGRAYLEVEGLSQLLGYVTHPKKDRRGVYWQREVYGREGVEAEYDGELRGETGSKLVEIDARGNVTSEGLTKPPKNGENITLSIDIRVQEKLYGFIRSLASDIGFASGAGVIMDVKTGELLAIVSYPEYSSTLLSSGTDATAIAALLKDTRKPFLNRAVAGLYTPGSIVKPYMALAALAEKVIAPEKEILSTGSISIPNPYFPDKPSIFKDWKAHGLVNMKRALAVSSDVYFYEIGGGFEGQKGLGIGNIEKYAHLFGLGEKTGIDLPSEAEGIVPNPDWKKENFNGDEWILGNTYHTVIGQYGFQVTPVQMARAVAAVGNEGTLLIPHVRKDLGGMPEEKINLDKEYFRLVKEGMRAAVAEGGTSQGLYIPAVQVAAKTGTAELGTAKHYVNSWVTGFFPYQNPRYSFAVVMERGPVKNTLGGVYVMRGLFDWMAENTPEYLK